MFRFRHVAARAILIALVVLPPYSAFALDDTRYFKGHKYVYERSERFESIFGGAVTKLRAYGHNAFEDPWDAILVEGVFSLETTNHVLRLLSNGEYSTIFLDSPGGDLEAGMKLGLLFKERNLEAVVARSGECKSACALAFLGAPVRFVLGKSSSIGFHRQYRIINQKVVYGDLAQDRRLIDRYLTSISASGVSAEEIASTTGDATFSESSLLERQVITRSAAQLKEAAISVKDYSFMTYFELLSLVCSKYDNRDLKRATPEQMVMILSCARRVPAVREPLLERALLPLPFAMSEESKMVLEAGAISALRSSDPAVVEAFNTKTEERKIWYEEWSRRRDASRRIQKALRESE